MVGPKGQFKNPDYVKVLDSAGQISRLFRQTEGLVEELTDEAWNELGLISEVGWPPLGLGAEELDTVEVHNLRTYLRSGRLGVPENLTIGPPERYKRWTCPECRTLTVVPVVIGYPSLEDFEAEQRGEIILAGCIVNGDEPARPVACVTCGWNGENTRTKYVRALPLRVSLRE